VKEETGRFRLAWCRKWPVLSLRGRLLLAAALTIVVAGTLTALSTRALMTSIVTRTLDTRLDSQIRALQSALTPQGRIDPRRLHLLPYFQNAPLQWGWRVEGPLGGEEGGARLGMEQPEPGQRPAWGQIYSSRMIRDGLRMHSRHLRMFLPAHGQMVVVTVAGPEELITEPMAAALRPAMTAIGVTIAALLVAAYAQLLYSLRPVLDLRRAVAGVRDGQSAQVEGQWPKELTPLADELNGLIRQNASGLENARHHVANLAHGLKTPLATLTLRLARQGADAETQALVADMARRIDHHLNRARSGAQMVGGRASADVAGLAGRLVRAMQHLHEARDLAFAVELGGVQRLAVDQALAHGKRLDESGQGYGFGLGIARELAEYYGGSLQLGRSAALGGLSATLRLPRRD
jgi:signal transduction histidine kinase